MARDFEILLFKHFRFSSLLKSDFKYACGDAATNNRRSVFFDLLDRAHRTFFHAVTTGDAGILVHNCCCVMHDIEYILWAGINADPTRRAFVGIDDWMWHGLSPLG
jgi:hypothetical protein